MNNALSMGVVERAGELDELGAVRLEVADEGEQLDRLLGEGFELEGSGWKRAQGTAITSATSRGNTSTPIGLRPMTVSASTSSRIFIEPISAVMRHPACTANPSAARSGANSRVMAKEDTAPATGPRSSMLSVPCATMATGGTMYAA